jgi:hypothetical protein
MPSARIFRFNRPCHRTSSRNENSAGNFAKDKQPGRVKHTRSPFSEFWIPARYLAGVRTKLRRTTAIIWEQTECASGEKRPETAIVYTSQYLAT